MADKQSYACENCGNQVDVDEGAASVPECCDRQMKKLPLPVCEASGTAEHYRFDEPLEPCDDGRAGE